MLLRGVGLRRAVRSTVILGAGASRGASFAEAPRQVFPPLDADFFQQAQRLDEQLFKDHGREVIEFVRDEFGMTQPPTLETLFTQLQGFDQFLQHFYARRGRRPGRYKKQLANLLELIPLLFRSALAGETCAWHDRIAYALRNGDTVINFNYDVLMDEALSRLGAGRWKADCGYGLKLVDGVDAWSAASTPGAFPRKKFLRLLKPHGSLHWAGIDRDRQRLRLEADAYAQRPAKGNIIPPTWDKQILGEWPWKPIWRQAGLMLQQTRCLIVVGYSVPQTDLMSQALIRSSLSEGMGNLRLVVVANPDADARARVIDLARAAITPSTRILELDTLRDFVGLLDETPQERREREQTPRRIRVLSRRVKEIKDSLEPHDLEDLEFRLDELEEHDMGAIESRLDALEEQAEES
jgi:hypothetical protein